MTAVNRAGRSAHPRRPRARRGALPIRGAPALTNAAWLFGSVAIAYALRRTRAVPKWVALGLVAVWFATIPLATVGGGVLAGAYFLAVGYLLVNRALGDGLDTVTAPASA